MFLNDYGCACVNDSLKRVVDGCLGVELVDLLRTHRLHSPGSGGYPPSYGYGYPPPAYGGCPGGQFLRWDSSSSPSFSQKSEAHHSLDVKLRLWWISSAWALWLSGQISGDVMIFVNPIAPLRRTWKQTATLDFLA